MFMKFWRAARWLLLSVTIFAAAILVSNVLKAPPPGDWWSPISALATVGAVIVALWSTLRQGADKEKRERHQDAALILGFQQLASEVARMCNLAGFQDDSTSNPILYPDISAEFVSIATMLSGLPMDRLAVHGQVSKILHLRRIALELSMIWDQETKRDGTIYRQNRTRIDDLYKRATTESMAIATYLEIFSPTLYEQNKYEIERL